MRRPVNAPGPQPKAMASSCARGKSACVNSRVTAGSSRADASAPPASLHVNVVWPWRSATESCSVEVSKANRLAVIGWDIDQV